MGERRRYGGPQGSRRSAKSPRRATSGDGLALVNRFRNGGADRCAALPARSLPMDRDQRDRRPDSSARGAGSTRSDLQKASSASWRTRSIRRERGRHTYIEPEPHLPHQVYTRDSSQTTPWGPALTQLALPSAPRLEIASILRFHGVHNGFWRHVQPWRNRGRGHSHHPTWTASCRLVGNPHNAGRGSPVRPLVRGRGLGDEAPFLPPNISFTHRRSLLYGCASASAVACVEVLD